MSPVSAASMIENLTQQAKPINTWDTDSTSLSREASPISSSTIQNPCEILPDPTTSFSEQFWPGTGGHVFLGPLRPIPFQGG